MVDKLAYTKGQLEKSKFTIGIALFCLFCFLYAFEYSPFLNYHQANILTNSLNTRDFCSGRYIYIHHLPQRFNDNVLRNCSSLYRWYNMCPCLKNSGFGPEVVEVNPNHKAMIFGEKVWFSTDQFFLELIFHSRIKRYVCLTNDSSLASAIYVPYYGGLDLGRHLWDYNTSIRDGLGVDLLKWLVNQSEWKKMYGADHFFAAGRIGWDFQRFGDDDQSWGGNLMQLPESVNITMLTIETTSWSNQFAVPYPSHFHPWKKTQILEWQNRIRKRKRKYLVAFAGAPRPGLQDSIRSEIISQCLQMQKEQKACKFLECNSESNKCDKPVEVIKVFQDSIFCLQPPGDSYTRRSTFDSILAGCIPVFFHPGSAYVQYVWYLPLDYAKYSVFIPINLVKNGSVSIHQKLLSFSNKRIMGMREEVIRLIPKIIYVNPLMSKLENVEDAFDIAVKRVLERIDKVRRNPAINFKPPNTWELKLSLMRQQQWESFFE